MKMIIVVTLALVACACAEDSISKIIRSAYEQNPEGGYDFNYESDDGTARQETGVVKEVLDEENKLHKVVVVRGTYSYTDSYGKPEIISYYADETGYHPEGESIPKQASRR